MRPFFCNSSCHNSDRVKLQDNVDIFPEREVVPALPALGRSETAEREGLQCIKMNFWADGVAVFWYWTGLLPPCPPGTKSHFGKLSAPLLLWGLGCSSVG